MTPEVNSKTMLLILYRHSKYRWESSRYLIKFMTESRFFPSSLLSGRMYNVHCTKPLFQLRVWFEKCVAGRHNADIGIQNCFSSNTSGQKRPSAHLHHLLFWLKRNFLDFSVLYSTLLHLPPLRFHCVGRCCDRTQDSFDYGAALAVSRSYVNMYIFKVFSKSSSLPICVYLRLYKKMGLISRWRLFTWAPRIRRWGRERGSRQSCHPSPPWSGSTLHQREIWDRVVGTIWSWSALIKPWLGSFLIKPWSATPLIQVWSGSALIKPWSASHLSQMWSG